MTIKPYWEYESSTLKKFSKAELILGIILAIVGIISLPFGIIFLALSGFFFYMSKKYKDTAIAKDNGTFTPPKTIGYSQPLHTQSSNTITSFPERDANGKRLLTIYDTILTGVDKIHNDINPQDIIPALEIGEEIFLQADVNNRYDEFAVKALDKNNNQIGWIPKGTDLDSEKLQTDIFNRLTNGQTVRARVKKGYTLNNGSIGIVIDVARYAVR